MALLSKEGRIGLVVALGCLGLLALAPSQRRRAPVLGHNYRLVFHELHGLKEGDQVTVGGVDAGRVINMDFAPRDQWVTLNASEGGDNRPVVIVTVALRRSFTLYPETGYKVVSTLRGRHFVNILPHTSGSELAEDSLLNEELAPEVSGQLQSTLRQFRALSAATEQMRARFANPVFRRDMKDLASNMRFYTGEFKRLSKGSRQQLASMSRALEAQQDAMLSRVQTMDQMNARMANYMNRAVPAMHAQLSGFRQKLADGEKQLQSMQGNGVAMLQRYQKMARQMDQKLSGMHPEQMAQRLHRMNRQLDDYANLAEDLHQITANPRVRADVRELPKRMKASSEGLRDRMHTFAQGARLLDMILPEEHK